MNGRVSAIDSMVLIGIDLHFKLLFGLCQSLHKIFGVLIVTFGVLLHQSYSCVYQCYPCSARYNGARSSRI